MVSKFRAGLAKRIFQHECWELKWPPNELVWDLTGLATPHARPKAAFDGIKTYGTFCNSRRHRIRAVPI